MSFIFIVVISKEYRLKNKSIYIPSVMHRKSPSASLQISDLQLHNHNPNSLSLDNKMQKENNSEKAGLSDRAIIIHSLSLTLLGIILFRLGTANTQSVVYAQIFSISGALIATVPWLAQFVVSGAAIVLYKAGVCDLSWLVKSESTSMKATGTGSDRRGSTAVVVDIVSNGGQGYEQGGKNASENESEGLAAMLFGVSERRIGPHLQRSRTV